MKEMFNNPLISIIVPVYNVEKYIHRCIDSIISQNLTDWECILVDDGSPDNCPSICDEYAKKDFRIKVIHQQNKGVSSARNTGLDVASGHYIAFVDSDDWIDPEMYEKMLNAIITSQSDIVLCGTIYEFKKNNFLKNRITRVNKLLVRQKFLKYFCKLRIQSKKGMLLHSPFNKLYTKKLFDNSRFDAAFSMGEDYILNLDIYSKVNSIFLLNKCFYHYCYNDDSACNIYNDKKIFDQIELIKKTYDFYNKNKMNLFSADDYASTIVFQVKKRVYLNLEKADKLLLNKEFEMLKKYCTLKFILKSIIHPRKMLGLMILRLNFYSLLKLL